MSSPGTLGGTSGAAGGGAGVDEANGLLMLLQPMSIGRPAKRTTANNSERYNWAIGMFSSQNSWSHCVALAVSARALSTVALASVSIMRRSNDHQNGSNMASVTISTFLAPLP